MAKPSILGTAAYIYKENGIRGLYRGVSPRICLGVWQTVCFVTFSNANLIRCVWFHSPTRCVTGWVLVNRRLHVLGCMTCAALGTKNYSFSMQAHSPAS